MDLKRSSYQFHRQLESPASFFRREWKAIAICAGGFSLAMIVGILLVDPAFFYSRLQTDPLNYFLKAKAFAETGSTSATWAVNLPPFPYVSMPGLLRVPMVMAFRDFDDQLRGMQLLNVPIVASVALMSAYIFSWGLPQSRHWMAIAFSFAFMLLSPIWVANVFLPLADAPYAAFTLAAMLVAIEILCSDKHAATRLGMIIVFIGLFVVSFLLRFTAPILLVFAGVLARARWQELGLSRRFKLAIGVAAALFLLVLVVFNIEAIFGRYLREPFLFLDRGEKTGMFINLVGAALPTQVIPSFQLGFMHPPIVDLYKTSFSNAFPDMAWAGFGILISVVIAAGMWHSRRRFLPEAVYLLAALPVITLMMPSTARYLMSYQAFCWIFFYLGAASLAKRYAPWMVRLFRSRVAVISGIVLAAGLVVGLRSWKVAGTASERYFAVTVTRIPAYVSDVRDTFRALRGFLETLPKDRTLLLSTRGAMGRWNVISDLDYYYADAGLSAVVKKKDVYLLVECGTLEACQAWDKWKTRAENRLRVHGDFSFDSVFAAQSGRARVEVLRLGVLN